MALDIFDYPIDYVEDFIYKFIPVYDGSPESEVLPQWESIVYGFLLEVKNKEIKIPVSLEDFRKDKELLKRIDSNTTLEIDTLYYLTLFVYDYAKGKTINSIAWGLTGLQQIEAISNILENDNVEITFKAGKEKFVLTDRRVIDFIFDGEKFAKTATDDDLRMLYTAKVLRKLKYENKYSYTDLAAVFTGSLFDYFENSNKELISYLAFITGIVSNDSIIASNDYINILLRNYKQLKSGEKKGLGRSFY